jgi:hypothetical protein
LAGYHRISSDIKGLQAAKDALEVAAASLPTLLIGCAGVGKTSLAYRLTTIFTPSGIEHPFRALPYSLSPDESAQVIFLDGLSRFRAESLEALSVKITAGAFEGRIACKCGDCRGSAS